VSDPLISPSPGFFGAPRWTRLWLLRPDRTLATIMDGCVDLEMDLKAWLNGTIKVKVPATHRMFSLEHRDIPILERRMENWGCWFFYRDPGDGSNLRFPGIVNPMSVRHSGRRGTGYVDIEFNHAFWELMRRRQLWTELGGLYEIEDTPDNIARDVIRKAFVSGAVVTPDDNTTDRTRLGSEDDPWVVTSEALHDPGDHPETLDYKIAHGTAVTKVLTELFQGKLPVTGTPTDIYPVLTEPTPGTFNIDIIYGKETVAPEERLIGRLLGDESLISPERQTMRGFADAIDRYPQMTSLEVRGGGKGISQRRVWLVDTEMEERVGVIENSWTCPDAVDDAELEFEGQTYLGEWSAGVKTVTVELVEREGRFVYPDQIDMMDTVPVYSGNDLFELYEVLDVLGINVKVPAPGFPVVTLTLGKLTRSGIAEMARHGGGGGAGGAGGGRPRAKAGATFGWVSRMHDDGNETAPDEADDTEAIIGENSTVPIYAYSVAASDPTGSGGREVSGLVIYGTPIETLDIVANSLVPIRLFGGGVIFLMATTAIPLGFTPPGDPAFTP
jgi:hypothetical protein